MRADEDHIAQLVKARQDAGRLYVALAVGLATGRANLDASALNEALTGWQLASAAAYRAAQAPLG